MRANGHGRRQETCELCGAAGKTLMSIFTTMLAPGDAGSVKERKAYCGPCAERAAAVLMLHGFFGPSRKDGGWTMTIGAEDGGWRMGSCRREVRFACAKCGEAGLELGDLEPDGNGGLSHWRDGWNERLGVEDTLRECGPVHAVHPDEDKAPPSRRNAVWACDGCGAQNIGPDEVCGGEAGKAGRGRKKETHFQPEESGNHDPCGPLRPTGDEDRPTWYSEMLTSLYGAANQETHEQHLGVLQSEVPVTAGAGGRTAEREEVPANA